MSNQELIIENWTDRKIHVISSDTTYPTKWSEDEESYAAVACWERHLDANGTYEVDELGLAKLKCKVVIPELPEFEEGKLLVVPMTTALCNPDRTDLITLDTSFYKIGDFCDEYPDIVSEFRQEHIVIGYAFIQVDFSEK